MSKGWETVKTHELCFCCLKEGHKVIECSWEPACNIEGSLKKRNRMLHSANQEDFLQQNQVRQSKISLMEGEEHQNTECLKQKVKKWSAVCRR